MEVHIEGCLGVRGIWQEKGPEHTDTKARVKQLVPIMEFLPETGLRTGSLGLPNYEVGKC